MPKTFDEFLISTGRMQDVLEKFDKNRNPIRWIKQKLRIMASIDAATRGNVDPEISGQINQHYRGAYERYDHWSTAQLKDILEMPIVKQSGGWIPINIFGKKASKNAWLIAQHADKDRNFQNKVLELMTPFYEAGQAQPSHYAYLYDRVQVFVLNQEQRYGSQGGHDTHGIWKPFPCEKKTPAELDQQASDTKMRTKKGLQWKLTEYFKIMNDGKDVPFSFLPPDYPKYEPA